MASMDQRNGLPVPLKTDDSRAGNVEDHAQDSGLGSAEESIAHCSKRKEAFVGKARVQRSAKAHLPNTHWVLAFVEAMVVAAFRHGVPDKVVFEPHEGSDIQLDAVYNLGLLSLARIVFVEEVHHLRQ